MSFFPDHINHQSYQLWCVTNLFGVLLQSSIPPKIPMFDASSVKISPYLPGESLLGGHVGLALVSKKLYRLAKVHEAHSFIPGSGFGG